MFFLAVTVARVPMRVCHTTAITERQSRAVFAASACTPSDQATTPLADVHLTLRKHVNCGCNHGLALRPHSCLRCAGAFLALPGVASDVLHAGATLGYAIPRPLVQAFTVELQMANADEDNDYHYEQHMLMMEDDEWWWQAEDDEWWASELGEYD
jgi:hypothetical protein